MTMQHSSAGDRRNVALVATAGLAAVAILLWLALGQTTAAFTDTTENPNNLFSTGSVELSNDRDIVGAIFTTTELLPGHVETGTITVTNESAAPMGVRLYTDSFTVTAGSGLADNLLFDVRLDDANGAVVFQGTLTEFAAATSWDNGLRTAPPAPGPAPGPLRTLLEDNLSEEQQEALPSQFWDAVDAVDGQADGAVVQLQEVVDGLPAGPVKDAVQGIIGAPATPTSEPAPPEQGDRLEEFGEDGSSQVYFFKVTLDPQAGAQDRNVNPDDAATIAFVWEGRA